MGEYTKYGYKLDQTGQQTQNILDAVNGKVDKVAGKGLSTNDYTDADKAKVDAFTPPVQPDWDENDNTKLDYVKNRTHWREVAYQWQDVKLTWTNPLIGSYYDNHFGFYDSILDFQMVSGAYRWEAEIEEEDNGVTDTAVYSIELYQSDSNIVGIRARRLFDGIYRDIFNVANFCSGSLSTSATITKTSPWNTGETYNIPSHSYHKLDNKYLDTTSSVTSGSDKPVTSGGVYTAVSAKYTKPATGIPAADLAEGVIPDVSNFITKSVNDLTYYYLKTETYSQTEINNLIGAIQQFHYEIAASTSAVTDPQPNVLYLIGPTGSGADKYEEYVYANSTWTKIGDTSIDLSDYVTTTALNTALADYTTTANLTTLLDGKQDTIDSTHKLDYSLLSNTPTIPAAPGTLNTNNTGAQSVSSSEALSGTIKLHKVAKTGSYADLNDVFIATYGSTTATEIANAITAGKNIFLRRDNFLAVYSRDLNGNYEFTKANKESLYVAILKQSNSAWSESVSYVVTSNSAKTVTTNTPSSSSTNSQVPTSKAVYDAIAADTEPDLTPVVDSDAVFVQRAVTPKSGVGRIGKIKGKTLVWNQLTENGDFASNTKWSAESGRTLSIANGVATIGVTASSTTNNGIYNNVSDYNALVVGHKYLVSCFAKVNTQGANLQISFNFYNARPSGPTFYSLTDSWARYSNILIPTVAATQCKTNVRITDSTTGGSADVKDVIVVDLTKEFDSGNEPSTVAEFEALYPLPYYNNNAGTLINNGAASFQTKDGNDVVDTKTLNLTTITGKLNGEGSSVTIFPEGLKSAGTVYDEIVGNKAIKRVGVVDMGTLNWSLRAGSSYTYNVVDSNVPIDYVRDVRMFWEKGVSVGVSAGSTAQNYPDYQLCHFNGTPGKGIYVNYPGFDSASAFKTAMSGVKLYYALATVETYVLDTPLDLVFDTGTTEERLPADTASSVMAPFRADIQYGLTTREIIDEVYDWIFGAMDANY